MKISLNWIKEYVEIPNSVTPEKLALDLTMSTVEVEKIIDQGKGFDKMVVGRVVELKQHPNADKLKIVMTDIGDGKIKQIICGGTNLFEGMLTCVALPGAKVRWHGEGDLVELSPTKIRGEESFGMICASEEIELESILPGKEKEIMNISFTEAKPGTAVATIFELDDVIIDIDNKSLTNRPDLWGHHGIAREIAAIYKVPLKAIADEKIEVKSSEKIKVKIKSSENCFRYISVVVDDISVGPSPAWLKKRLAAVGQKSINNIVDLTNYVLFETGQPMHAFDFANIDNGQIVIRQANDKEPILTLDDEEKELSAEDLVIADGKKPIAIAGIIGGQYSGINEKTKKIVFESAAFNFVSIRQTSRVLGIRTESSIRFEKGIDANTAEIAMRRILVLVKKIIPEAKIGLFNDEYQVKTKDTKIKTDLNFINKRLGKELTSDEVVDILTRLQFQVKVKNDKFEILVPSFRATNDISIPEDIVEEIARIHGYLNIEPDLPTVKLISPIENKYSSIARRIKNQLSCNFKFIEVRNYPFVNETAVEFGYELDKHVKLNNYISAEHTMLRTSLLPSLIKNIADNQRWESKFKLFEFGRRFRLDKESKYQRGGKLVGYLPWQNYQLAGAVVSDNKNVFYDIKGIAENILKSLNITNYSFAEADDKIIFSEYKMKIMVGDKKVGYIFNLNKNIITKFGINGEVGIFEFDFDDLVDISKIVYKYKPLAKYPNSIYDLAIVFDKQIKWQEINKQVKKNSKLINSIKLFDVYQGDKIAEDKKSIAFSIEFFADDRTLTSEEMEKEIAKILKGLQQNLGGELRK